MQHPYLTFEGTAIWTTIAAAIADLEENQDIQLTTAREYVIGYLCQQLAERHLISMRDNSP